MITHVGRFDPADEPKSCREENKHMRIVTLYSIWFRNIAQRSDELTTLDGT